MKGKLQSLLFVLMSLQMAHALDRLDKVPPPSDVILVQGQGLFAGINASDVSNFLFNLSDSICDFKTSFPDDPPIDPFVIEYSAPNSALPMNGVFDGPDSSLIIDFKIHSDVSSALYKLSCDYESTAPPIIWPAPGGVLPPEPMYISTKSEVMNFKNNSWTVLSIGGGYKNPYHESTFTIPFTFANNWYFDNKNKDYIDNDGCFHCRLTIKAYPYYEHNITSGYFKLNAPTIELSDKLQSVRSYHYFQSDSVISTPEFLWDGNTYRFLGGVCADGTNSTYIEFTPYLGITDPGFYQKSLDMGNENKNLGTVKIVGPDPVTNLMKAYYAHPDRIDGYQQERWFNFTYPYSKKSNSSLITGSYRLGIYHTPVLMVHGYGSNDEIYAKMKDALQKNGWPEYFYLQRALNYESYSTYSLLENFDIIPDEIYRLLRDLSKLGISASKVDIVCHSMGGLLSRQYINSPGYRDDVYHLITCNTPHAGTYFANVLRSDPFPMGINILMGNGFQDSAGEDLCANSEAIKRLNTTFQYPVLSRAIVTTSPFAGASGPLSSKFKFIIKAYTNLFGWGSPEEFYLNIFPYDKHDLIVPVQSQLGGCPAYKIIPEQWHVGSTNNQKLIDEVITSLKGNESLYANAFHPEVFIPTSRISQASPHNFERQSYNMISGAVSIDSPIAGTLVTPGAELTVAVSGRTDLTKVELAIATGDDHFFNEEQSKSNATFYDTIPTTATGTAHIVALGYKDGNIVGIDSRSLDLKVPVGIVSLRIQPDHFEMPATHQQCFSIYGRLSNGKEINLNTPKDFEYQVSDNKTAHIISPRILYGDSQGSGNLIINYQNLSCSAPIAILPANAWDQRITTLLAVNAGGPYQAEKVGNTASVTLSDANIRNPEVSMLVYQWATNAPGAVFDDPTILNPKLTFNATANIGTTYSATIMVSDGTSIVKNAATIKITDTMSPIITLNGPAPLTLEAGVDTYIEPGATALDAAEGSIPVTIGGDTVDTHKVGTYVVTYSAVDSTGNTATVTRTVNVHDTTPPLITLNGGNSITLECQVDTYSELSATVSDACDPQPTLTISGSVNDKYLGIYSLIYSATDAAGNKATPVTRTIVVQDTTPPTLSVNVIPNQIWPPNHKMVEIRPSFTVSDSCDPAPIVKLIQIVMREEILTSTYDPGSGDTKGDMLFLNGKTYIRSERLGNTTDRRYTLTYQAQDASGNKTTATAVITIPHDQR